MVVGAVELKDELGSHTLRDRVPMEDGLERRDHAVLEQQLVRELLEILVIVTLSISLVHKLRVVIAHII